ncbi:hypothetical protein APE_2311.1 [Aeropyrum pernix K1]|uniref:DUF2797 domain-containing protein n=1 Tax=Aeropyrum pernix (strain ATCC 700893 / DSM 11879 / JCM 9820 / NBRC 100138 / K1) TaxID=272557 RepID=Q9Y9H7_AERPE|nr:DUF2797 domain-containing protein [Aeropyrum pernix]BAA81323.2 hypothetical protein APE_2311.1 [Aeropyrum pernix K1]
MAGPIVPRAVYKDLIPRGLRRVSVATLGGRESFDIEYYVVEVRGLIAHKPPTPDAELIGVEVGLEIAPRPWVEMCRWHSGPLDRPDDPLSRIYCTSPAQGFCRQHRRSERALYDECFGSQGERGLWACKALDETASMEYAVYLTAFYSPSAPVKVGVTRRFRLLERVAEQPHIAATAVAFLDSAYKARLLEIEIGRRGIARQSTRKTRIARYIRRMEPLIALRRAAEEASSLAGENWGGKLFAIEPPGSISDPAQPRPGLKFTLGGYWGGLLGLRSRGATIWVKSGDIMHKTSLAYAEA